MRSLSGYSQPTRSCCQAGFWKMGVLGTRNNLCKGLVELDKASCPLYLDQGLCPSQGGNETLGFLVPSLIFLRGSCPKPALAFQSKRPASAELAGSSAAERGAEKASPGRGISQGEAEHPQQKGGLHSQVKQGRGTSPETSAAPHQAHGAWPPAVSSRSYFPFLPYTCPLAASCLGPARMKLEAGLGWWAAALSHY